MLILNILLMTAVIIGIVSLLAWAIASDRRSKRTTTQPAASVALSQHEPAMPHELRARRAHTTPARTAKARASVA